ncbi:MAG TPA: G5 domain-containing protein [Flexilinea sp.]|nr:G5 domain-containing protein [Flexilinea sp.]HPJ65109.1 G5 domain-containing protein [Flexilinea sp.]HQG88284.1 G5 domain-containing protein [Flexilinea sp.]HQJ01551.1 G5 domain-containing protein [Flexilinea sp.]
MLLFFSFLLIFSANACQTVDFLNRTGSAEKITVNVEKGGNLLTGTCAAGSTVEQALQELKVKYQPEDIITPVLSTVLSEDTTVKITSVTFEEEQKEQPIPFKSLTVQNESIPEGETYIIQAGQNGSEKITIKSTFEDGVLVSQVTSERNVIRDAVPEILMYGVKAEHAPIQIPGKIVYISNGSAWLLENTTGNRIPIVTSGDLDGRVLDLSSDGEWLLYSRKTQNDAINSLWMLHITDWNAKPIDLRISNVIHFAAWLPGEARRLLYSTVTPQESAPGWKANNDLLFRLVSDTGMLMEDETIVQANDEGPYSWWGTEFYLSKDGRTLLYATPGSIGKIDRLTGEKKELTKIQPYEKTRSDWAWIPGVTWSSDETAAFFAFHGEIEGTTKSYDPTDFNIGKINLTDGQAAEIKSGTGLFSQPAASPLFEDGSSYIAYMQTISPLQSESSRYRIMLMDSDGGNAKAVFPLDEEDYVTPQRVIWSPTTVANQSWIAIIYKSNIWLVNPFTGIYNQITIDQSVTKMIWK